MHLDFLVVVDYRESLLPSVDTCAGHGSCLWRNGNAVDLGQALSSSQLQIDDSGDILVEYFTNSTSQSTECLGRGTSSTIRFRCPGRQLVSFACNENAVTVYVTQFPDEQE